MSISLSPKLSDRNCPVIGYGLKNGAIGVLELGKSQADVIWHLQPDQINDVNCAPVSLVKCCNLNKKSLFMSSDVGEQNELIVARDDGRIEIYSYLNSSAFPTLCFESQIKSTITGIGCGHITLTSSKDILLSCYDGKILAVIDSKKFKD